MSGRADGNGAADGTEAGTDGTADGADGTAGQSGPGRREVAHRVFAAEYDDATHSYSESEEERAPSYVVTPTGARANRLFVVGVLTAVEQAGESNLRARVVDPTGAFVVYAGQYEPEAMATLERLEVPAFVAVTGKARTFESQDGERVFSTLRPESITEVDAETRDRWVLATAEQTLARVATMADALDRPERGDELRRALLQAGVDASLAAGIPRALSAYGTTGAYLGGVRELALDAVRVVANRRDAVAPLDLAPDEGAEAPPEGIDAGREQLSVPVGVGDERGGGEPGAVDDLEVGDSEPAADENASDASTDSAPVADDRAPADGSVAETETEREADEGTEQTPDDAAAAAADAPTANAAGTDASASGAGDSAGERPGTDAGTTADPPAAPDDGTADEPADEAVSEPDDRTVEDLEEETGDAADAGPPETDEMYELDESEREAVESEFGVEFASGDDIPDAGEADIDVPDEPPTEGESTEEPPAAEAPAEEAARPGDATVPEDEDLTASGAGGASEPDGDPPGDQPGGAPVDQSGDGTRDGHGDESGDDSGETTAAEEAAAADPGATATGSLEDAVVDRMRELADEGGGEADRATLVADVAAERGVAEDAVEDAIQDALMSGRCFEADGAGERLTPI